MANPNPNEISLSSDEDTADYEVAHDPAMAAALGFTSFGDSSSSRPAKKRRYNPQSDTAVIATPLTAHKAQQSKSKPKPKPKPKSTKPKPKDEITYSSSDDNNNNNNQGDDDDDFELDTTADLDLDPDAPPTPSLTTSASTSTPNLSLPARPPSTSTSTNPVALAQSGHGNRGALGGRGGGRAGQPNRGPHNPLWYVDYYESSSNENPWEGMEKFKGLGSVGSWVPRFWDRVGTSQGTAGDGSAGAGDDVEDDGGEVGAVDLDVGEEVA